jgi:hypothetical protein
MTIFKAALAATLFLSAAAPAAAIVGGEDAPELDPHLVMIVSDRGGFCSGVVVSRRAVLTAAHCVTTPGAAYRLHWRDAASGAPVMVEPERVIPHPRYRKDAEKTRVPSVDLAIVRSKEPLPARFLPARLGGTGTPVPDKDALLRVAGYGLSLEWDGSTGGRLRSVALPVITPHSPGRVLVWLSGKQGSGACQGDSGGAILDPAGTVVAVTAWAEGSGGRRCGAITQGVLVAPERAWIDATIAAR